MNRIAVASLLAGLVLTSCRPREEQVVAAQLITPMDSVDSEMIDLNLMHNNMLLQSILSEADGPIEDGRYGEYYRMVSSVEEIDSIFEQLVEGNYIWEHFENSSTTRQVEYPELGTLRLVTYKRVRRGGARAILYVDVPGIDGLSQLVFLQE